MLPENKPYCIYSMGGGCNDLRKAFPTLFFWALLSPVSSPWSYCAGRGSQLVPPPPWSPDQDPEWKHCVAVTYISKKFYIYK